MDPQATEAAVRAASPDFSSLSPDELDRLELVLQKQVRVENEQNQRLSGLRRTMVHLQQSIQSEQRRQRTFSSTTSSHSSSPVQSNADALTSSNIVQCYICHANLDIQVNAFALSPPYSCADCQRPVCRRCGNYASPELIQYGNQPQPSKWRCRMCIVRREVVRKSGSWNLADDDTPVHSPVRLLQKLSAYRAASASTPVSPSPSPQHERKSTLLSESSNFFTRLWRPTTTRENTPSPILIASQETNSSSFDQIPEPSPVINDRSACLIPSPRLDRRMSFIREVSTKNPPPPSSFASPPAPSPTMLKKQLTTSSTITDPSLEDTTSEQPYDTTSEFHSQSFETNMDGSNPSRLNEGSPEHQPELTYDERQRRLSTAAKSALLSSGQQISSLPMRIMGQYHRDSLGSPEANIDVSMAMDCFSNSTIRRQSMKAGTKSFTSDSQTMQVDQLNQRRTSRSGLSNSDTWVRKRALMHRGYQWTTTFEALESSGSNDVATDKEASNARTPAPQSSSSSLSRSSQANSYSPPATMLVNTKSESPNQIPSNLLRRRRSSRRLPEIPSHGGNSRNIAMDETSTSDEIVLPYSMADYPPQRIRDNSLSNRSTRSKSIDSDTSIKTRSIHLKLGHTHQSPNAKSVDLSNLMQQKSSLIINNGLLPQRSLDYPCIVRKAPDLSDIVRRRMLYSRISKQQGDNFSLSLEREHVPKVPRKIIIRQDNSIEIALSKPPKLRRQTLSEEYYYGCNSEAEFTSIAQTNNASSTLGLPLPSSASGLSVSDRRKTIETCENIFLQAEESSKLRARTPPSNPHRILLHRDKNDTSIRTNGLGMRIIGGQECEDGSLGCFVTNIILGGPADVQGNIEVGDQILEFNGHSLIESTYEEVRILQDHCGDIVQLVVQHNNVRLQINGGQTLSSIEISRHFETVPRLASSLTRKRRNLPPLPPSFTSTFPKQKKRDLFETVETLEVPNVKELKPILINRGRLLAQIWHDVEDMKLALTIIQAINLPFRSNGDHPYTFITGKMLFEDRGFDMFETKVIHSSAPIYNETFVFHEVETVDVLHLEVFLWDKKHYQLDRQTHHNNHDDDSDDFLGMIQLPLSEANLEDEPRWYELRDRQTRKPSTSSVTFKSSSVESGDSCRKMPPLLPSIKNQNRAKSSSDLLTRTLNRSAKNKMITNRKSFNPRSDNLLSKRKSMQRASLTSPTVPSIITTSMDDDESDDLNARQRSTIAQPSDKLHRRISKGILKFFDFHTRRLSESMSKSLEGSPTHHLTSPLPAHMDTDVDMEAAAALVLENPNVIINRSPRHSVISTTHADDQQQQQQQQLLIRPIPLQQMPIGQLMLPYLPSSRHSSISGSRKSSAASYCESDDDIDRYFTLSEQLQQQQQSEQMSENSHVQTHTVGPGQVTPRNYENMINDYIYMGQIQLGLIVTKGLLEIDVICARGLERVIDDNCHGGPKMDNAPPDTYVKTYLRTGTRRVQKRKTATIKANYNPEYHAKLKYNACNVMGRRLQVTVWQRASKFSKNQCIGEAFIQLDNLTLTQHTMAWYKLFREKLVESEFYDSS